MPLVPRTRVYETTRWLPFLSDVFSEFLATNMLNMTPYDIAHYNKLITHHITYFHKKVPFRASLSTFELDGIEWSKLVISSMGISLCYGNVDVWQSASFHDLYMLQDVLKHFPHYTVSVVYNTYKRQVNVKLSAVDKNDPNVLISFVPGYPETDYDERENTCSVREILAETRHE